METIICNVHIAPTDKREIGLYLDTLTNRLYYLVDPLEIIQDFYKPCIIYITSNEEIKKGDWFVKNEADWVTSVYKCTNKLNEILSLQSDGITVYTKNKCAFKIIASTDALLTQELPNLSKLFLESFIKHYNKGIYLTKVNVEIEYFHRSQSKSVVECAIKNFTNKRIKVYPDNTIFIIFSQDVVEFQSNPNPHNGLWNPTNRYRLDLLNTYAKKLVNMKPK